MTFRTPAGLRAACRDGWTVPTSCHAAGATRGNPVALPKDRARDSLPSAQRNPKLCTMLDFAELGRLDTVLSGGVDLRRGLPLRRASEVPAAVTRAPRRMAVTDVPGRERQR